MKLAIVPAATINEPPPAASSEGRLLGQPTASDHRPPRALFFLTIFLSAFLLFQVQLIIGKFILPSFGGAPAVWNTCMLWFQALLLLGYGYAHVVGTFAKPRVQRAVHISLLLASVIFLAALAALWGSPLIPASNWKPQPTDNPVWKIIQVLSVSVTLPFFILSTTGPLLQKWFSIARPGESPYRLYALSNVGSLLGLLSYPFFAEWAFNIHQQAWIWSAPYVAFVSLCAAIATRLPGIARPVADSPAPRAEAAQIAAAPSADPSTAKPRHYLLWITLSTCSSVMLLATTNRLCQDVAVIPLLWVIPLSLYLISFVITFHSDRFYQRRLFAPILFLAIGLALRATFVGSASHVFVPVAIYCLALFSVCMVCHGELARSKPAAAKLTSFYFMVAGGGVLGGIFVVLVAPQLFRGFWEFEIALIACGLLLLAGGISDPRPEPLPWAIAAALIFVFLIPQASRYLPAQLHYRVLNSEYFSAAVAAATFLSWACARHLRRNSLAASAPARARWPAALACAFLTAFAIAAYLRVQGEVQASLFQGRNFFGVTYVLNAPEYIMLKSGSTLHGLEFKDRSQRHNPTIYYRRASGIGLLLSNYPRTSMNPPRGINLGVVGLGAGTLAAYAQPSDHLRYYEIDPTVIQLSQGAQPLFHFVQDSPATIEAVLGDARLSLERELAEGRAHDFDVLVVDAFSGDAIPVHLLTREAMEIYLRRLQQPSGVIAIHISNEYLDLAPVLAGLRDAYQLHAVEVQDVTNLWVLLSKEPAMLQLANLAERARPITLKKSPILWTDNYSNLFQILK